MRDGILSPSNGSGGVKAETIMNEISPERVKEVFNQAVDLPPEELAPWNPLTKPGQLT